MNALLEKFNKYKSVIFDCDGVLIDSNSLKTEAFFEYALFAGKDKANLLVNYHIKNGGISRYDKIKYFFNEIIHKDLSKRELNQQANLYGKLVFEKLLKAKVTRGLEVLRRINQAADWYVVSGGDQKELIKLFEINGLNSFFPQRVFGSPKSKEKIIIDGKKKNFFKRPLLFIGDSKYDMMVARKFKMDFIFLSDWSEWIPARYKEMIKFKSIQELSNNLNKYHTKMLRDNID